MPTRAPAAAPRRLLSRIKAAVPLSVKARLLRKDGLKPTAASVWDQEFQAGQWDFLADISEVGRYAVVAGYHQIAAAHETVLDVGCGAGLLQPWLRRAGYQAYLGIDLSAEAIGRAQAGADEATRFEAANAEAFVPPRAFDVIIFNEMLYYMVDPVGVLRRYGEHLTPEGTFIVSLWDSRESVRTWAKCRRALTVLDETRVVRPDLSWRIRLCRPAD